MRKQLFYLTNSHLAVHVWQDGRLGEPLIFPHGEEGWQAFSDYLGANGRQPGKLLVDLVEEDFQRDSVPHVTGRARNLMIERRLSQGYRETPYRHASVLGREKVGRKDDLMLFSAITNAELVTPWVDAMLDQSVPLAGMYSVALLSARLLKRLDIRDDSLLLLTHQSSGLRQSYFHEGRLRFSRLTPVFDHDPHVLAETLLAETAKARQFLASTRLLPRDAPVTIATLTHPVNIDALSAACAATATTCYRFIGLDEAARQVGLAKTSIMPAYCEDLFLHMLTGHGIGSHYPVPEPQRLYRLWQTRIGLGALSAATVAVALSISGWNGLEAIQSSNLASQAEMEAQAADARYRTLVGSMPVMEKDPGDMRIAVQTHDMIARNAPAPEALFDIVSQAVERQPLVQINQVDWRSSEVSPSATAVPPAYMADPPLPGALIGVPARPYEVLEMEGEVSVPTSEMRTALSSVEQLAADLGKFPNLSAEIVRTPLDLRPTAKLEGGAGGNEANVHPQFAIKIIRKP